MNSFILPLLMAAPPADGAQGNPLLSFLPFILIIGIFYFLIIRPQSKKRKETEKMLASIRKGDKIITIGGLYGTVQRVKEKTVILKIDDNVKVEFLRSAVSSIEAQAQDKDDDEDDNENKIEDKTDGDSNNE